MKTEQVYINGKLLKMNNTLRHIVVKFILNFYYVIYYIIHAIKRVKLIKNNASIIMYINEIISHAIC